jgi:hypothetical protein
VNRLGTETQKERWTAGVMPIKEAIALIIAETVKPLTDAGIETMDPTEYHIGDADWDQDETEKRTLNDSEWTQAKKIKTILGDGWTYCYWIQTAKSFEPDDYDEEGERTTKRMVLIRCAKRVGEIEVSVDVEIG